MHLEDQLRTTADEWFSTECIPPQKSAQLEALVRAASRRRRLVRIGAAAAAAGVAALALNWPAVISAASDTPLVGPFIQRMATRDQGALWAEDKGYVVPVGKADTKQGYTFRVESVAADASRTIIYFSIDGPNLTKASTPPDITAIYNRFPAPVDGYGSMQWEVVDGRMIGQVNLAPLPHPAALVGLTVSDIAGVRGTWNVSFMASRTELDQLTRTVAVQKHLKGDGYDFVVERVLLAPTETRVEMTGIAADSFDMLHIELLANDQPVARHGGAWGGHARTTSGETHPLKFDLPFERVDGAVTSLTLRLVGVKRWVEGGPVMDLTARGSTVEHSGVSFSLQSVSVDQGETKVALRISGDEAAYDKAWGGFADWVLTDASGREYPVIAGRSATDSLPMSLTVRAEVPSPVRLEARRHTEPAQGDMEITIPLK